MELTKIVNSQQMYEVDRRTINEFGTPGSELMERAGRAVVEAIAARWDGLAGLRVVVVCGKGNNGGDGYVIGRLLHENSALVHLFLAANRDQVDGDAAEHMRRLEASGVQVEGVEGDGGRALNSALSECDLVVDALLGIGLRAAPRELVHRVIGQINDAARPIVAVDLPSGVDADTGAVPGIGVRAGLTVSFGLPKLGHLLYPGKAHCGALQLADIGFAEEALRDVEPAAHLLDDHAVGALLPRRPGDVHKGRCGTVAVVAGSVGMTGAAALTAEAALRAGAGRVSLGVPASLNDIMEIKLTEVMTQPLAEVRRHRCLALRALGHIEKFCAQASVLALGPGLGRHRETAELVRRVVRRSPLPLVLDADGLNACVGAVELLAERTQPTILTPHMGEFARLSELSREEIRAHPIELSREFAVRYEVTLVLKGAPTFIAFPNGRVIVNPTGNAGMATAGAGDVLTGLVAGLWAQGMEADHAASLAVYVHGAAGDRARDRLGEWSLTAGDIAAELPAVMVELARI